jgi:nucleotide-binding universal stress UspA family protein
MRERLAGTSVQISAEICVGKAYREIVEFALRANAMTLVVGTHVQADGDNVFLGSVAERVVRYAHCTVVVAKSEGFFESLRQSRG